MNKYKDPTYPWEYKFWKKNDVSHVPDYPNTTAHMKKRIDPSIVGNFKLLKYEWELSWDSVPSVHLQFEKVPNWFHRKMFSILLGVKWRKL